MYKLSLTLILTLALAGPVFVSNSPRSVYSDDPRDPWNHAAKKSATISSPCGLLLVPAAIAEIVLHF